MGSFDQNKQEVFDPIRKKWVALSPEEKVRQSLIAFMIEELLYPQELLCVEKSLSELPSHTKVSVPDRRIDILCFAKNIHPEFPLYPLLLVECKESSTLAQMAKDQVIGYNHFVKAYFLAVAYPNGVEWGYFDRKEKKYIFKSGLPTYQTLIKASVSCK